MRNSSTVPTLGAYIILLSLLLRLFCRRRVRVQHIIIARFRVVASSESPGSPRLCRKQRRPLRVNPFLRETPAAGTRCRFVVAPPNLTRA